MGCEASKATCRTVGGGVQSMGGSCACCDNAEYAPTISFFHEDQAADLPPEHTRDSICLTGVIELWRCKIPVSHTIDFARHFFVVFEAGNYWWSLEKGSRGVRLNYSRRSDRVIMQWDGEARDTPEKLLQAPVLRDISLGSVEMMAEPETSTPYHALWSNCVRFATSVFMHATGITRTSFERMFGDACAFPRMSR